MQFEAAAISSDTVSAGMLQSNKCDTLAAVLFMCSLHLLLL
jgi:hypothetical protein